MACFGRGELIERVVGLAENLTSIALIGAGGIGKTSTALTVLHDDRIKQRFGDNRRFIRCDKFPASLSHFLHRLSTVIGAGVKNPEDLTPLRPFLSSREIFIVLDNAESVLDPQGRDAREIYAVVEELSRFNNVCLCVTSRISIVPPTCKSLDIPMLSMEAACDTFYHIYTHGERSDPVDGILKQLDFHPMSITLLATVAYHNKWGTDRLIREWETRRINVLRTQHNQSLAATIELSLASLMFQELGPDARELLGVVAFFPQGVDENNINWLFPTISDRTSVFDNFCNLSLTYRSGGFVTMLAPLRDYLSPKDPGSSLLLCTTRDSYFSRLSVDVTPDDPGFEETRWIVSEDANIEHLFDALTPADTNSDNFWSACTHFMEHLYWHKPRLVVLGPKIEGLPDGHPTKPQCLMELSRLFLSVGNHAESKRLLVQTLTLWRERGDDLRAARTLTTLSLANRRLGLHKEGIPQAKEASEICERFHDISGQVQSLQRLARLLYEDNQLDAAEEAVTRALDLSSGEGDQFMVCGCHRLLGEICHSKGKTEMAINHLETAIGIASPPNWPNELFWCYFALVEVFSDNGRFDDAHINIEHTKSHVVSNPYHLGRVTSLHAVVLRVQGRLEEARSEALRAAEVFEAAGAVRDLGKSRALLRDIEKEMNNLVATRKTGSDGELPKAVLFSYTY